MSDPAVGGTTREGTMERYQRKHAAESALQSLQAEIAAPEVNSAACQVAGKQLQDSQALRRRTGREGETSQSPARHKEGLWRRE